MTTSSTRQLCQNFYSSSTLHGLHYVFDSTWTIRRIVWFLLLGSSMIYFGFQAHSMYQKWKKHEVYITTTFQVKKELTFPSVTLCNRNMLKKSRILGKDGQFFLDAQDTQYISEWFNLRNRINKTFNIEKEVMTNGHNVKDVIKEMTFSFACPDNINNITTKTTFDPTSGLCHTINVNSKVRKLGESYGLSLVLDAEPHEYYGPYSYDGPGFRMKVHHPGTIPALENDGILVPTGFKTNIKIRAIKKMRLPEPYPSKCGTRKLKSSHVYRQNNCVLEKYTEESGKKCGCRVLGSPVVSEDTMKYCSVEQLGNCAYGTLYHYTQDEDDCPKECSSVSYNVKTSSIVFPSKLLLERFSTQEQQFCGEKYNFHHEFVKTRSNNESISDWFRGRYAKVAVFFSSKEVEVVEERPAFDSLDFAGSLGGNMGLYLGCSILTLFEFADILLMLTIQWLKNFRKKRNEVSSRLESIKGKPQEPT